MERIARQNTFVRLLREHFWGIVLIVGLLIASNIAVKMWKARHPGAMSVIEAQAMDMTAMKPPKGAVPVATEVVGRSGFTAKVTYTGSVAPYTEQNIYPRVEGWLKDLHVYNGDKVSAGKLLAVIDSPDLQTRVAEASAGQSAAASEISVAQSGTARMQAERAAAQGEIETTKSELAGAEARFVAAKRGVTQAEKEIKSVRASLEYWRAQIKREENLLKSGAISLQEYQSEKAQAVAAEAEVENKEARLEEVRAMAQAAQAEVSAKRAMINVARQRVAAADAAVAASHREVAQKSAVARQSSAMVSTASTIDSYRYIKAPFAGLVTKRYIHPGVFVKPSDAILNLVQIDKVRFQANVADKDVARIQPGALVVARLPKDQTKAYYSVVTSVSPLADQSSRTATVEAIVDNPGHKLVPGDFVTMEIAVSNASEQLSVPTSAIVRRDGRDAVWIVKSEAQKGKMTYYCTMHPEVTSDKPGLCPKCNMKLEPKTSGGGKKAHLVFVTLGGGDGERTEIASGLNDGNEVIYRGHTYIKEGEAVFPTKWGEDGPREMPESPGMSGEMPGHGNHNGKQKNGSPETPQMDHSDMDHGNMPEMDRSAMPAIDHSKMNHSKKAAGKKIEKAQKTYICPMHPEIVSHKEGETCPECGMFLEEKK